MDDSDITAQVAALREEVRQLTGMLRPMVHTWEQIAPILPGLLAKARFLGLGAIKKER